MGEAVGFGGELHRAVTGVRLSNKVMAERHAPKIPFLLDARP